MTKNGKLVTAATYRAGDAHKDEKHACDQCSHTTETTAQENAQERSAHVAMAMHAFMEHRRYLAPQRDCKGAKCKTTKHPRASARS